MKTPRSWHTLQFVLTSVLKLDPRSNYKGWYRHGDQQFARTSQIADAFGDCHRQPDHVTRSELNLAGVDASSDVEPYAVCLSDDLLCRPHRSGCGVEGGQEPIAHGLDLAPPVTDQRGSNHHVVVMGKGAPFAVAHTSSVFGGRGDVGKQDGSRRDLAFGCLVRACEELLDLVEDGVGIAAKEQMVLAGKLDVLRARNVLTQIATGADPDEPVPFSMKDQGGNDECGQK
jgi:hypothetical protein